MKLLSLISNLQTTQITTVAMMIGACLMINAFNARNVQEKARVTQGYSGFLTT
jgi:hypothetical protein